MLESKYLRLKRIVRILRADIAIAELNYRHSLGLPIGVDKANATHALIDLVVKLITGEEKAPQRASPAPRGITKVDQ